METSKSRHTIISGLICKQCGNTFSARKQRVDAGLGKFCSRKCSSFWKAEQTGKQYVGKENGKVTFDTSRNLYYVYWFEPNTLQRKTTSYARWWWEVNRSEIPDGYRASYKDGNPLNIEPDNIIIISSKEFGAAISKRLMGHLISFDSRKKMSIAHQGTSEWNGFVSGGKYANWSKHIKNAVKERDNYLCQICNDDLRENKRYKVHHIDGNKHNSVMENLLLLCTKCHALVHSKKDVENRILSLRSRLL